MHLGSLPCAACGGCRQAGTFLCSGLTCFSAFREGGGGEFSSTVLISQTGEGPRGSYLSCKSYQKSLSLPGRDAVPSQPVALRRVKATAAIWCPLTQQVFEWWNVTQTRVGSAWQPSAGKERERRGDMKLPHLALLVRPSRSGWSAPRLAVAQRCRHVQEG